MNILLYFIPLLIFWCAICGLMFLYDRTRKRGYAVIGMLPLSITILICSLYIYIKNQIKENDEFWDIEDWEEDDYG